MKRLISILLAFLLVIALLPSVLSAENLTLLAVNDTLPVSLSDETMPFYRGGLLYLPASVFTLSALDLDVSYATDTLVMAGGKRKLTFQISDGTVKNESGRTYSFSAIETATEIYVPAAYVTSHFGFTLSSLTSAGGYDVARITTGEQVYDNTLFLERAENMIAYRVAQYTAPVTPPTVTTPTPSQPDVPTPTPVAPPASVYLLLEGADGAPGARAYLREHNLSAAFFFSAEEIQQSPALIIDLVSDGYPIGIRLTGEEPDALDAVRTANAALDRILHTKTLLVLAPRAFSGSTTLSGYCVIARTSRTAYAAAQETNATLLVCADANDGVAALGALTAADCTLLPLRETSQYS